MKIKLPEHDHKLTNLLKVLLFSLLMLLPFLDIGTRCGYVLLNKNAYQSYSENYELLQQKMDNGTELIEGNEYMLHCLSNNADTNYSKAYGFSSTSYDISIFGENLNLTHIGYLAYNNGTYRVYALNNGNIGDRYYSPYYKTIPDITFTSTGDTIIVASGYIFYSLYLNTYKKQTLDNVFDYSIDKMANSPLYNWTTQTGMYTGVNAMTTGLGITTPLFAILITYWMFLTIIYIILDIVLTLMTRLTHIFTKEKD